MTGVKPAVQMALKHDFWSIRGHRTYLAVSGRRPRSATSVMVMPMPVAIGRRRLCFALRMPDATRMSLTRQLVSCTRKGGATRDGMGGKGGGKWGKHTNHQ